MKRLIFILFATFYCLTSTGFSVSIHYCLDELTGIELFGQNSDCCCGDEQTMSDCCDDEGFKLASQEDQRMASFSYDFSPLPEAHISSQFNTTIEQADTEQRQYLFSTDIPPPGREPLWLMHCSLVTYG